MKEIIEWDLSHQLKPNWWYTRHHFHKTLQRTIDWMRDDVANHVGGWDDPLDDSYEHAYHQLFEKVVQMKSIVKNMENPSKDEDLDLEEDLDWDGIYQATFERTQNLKRLIHTLEGNTNRYHALLYFDQIVRYVW